MDSFWAGLLLGLLICLVAGALMASRLRARTSRVRRSLSRILGVSKRRAQRLRAQAQSVQRLAELGTLTGGLAHEIRNPLSTVLLNLQLLQEDLDANDPAKAKLLNRLNTVSREAARLRDILDDFLRYAGKIELRKQKVNLNQLLEELTDFFAPQAQNGKVQLRLKPAAEPLWVELDPRLIKQVILNLMINAQQAMPAGGEMILSAARRGDEAIVDVIDTGTGIPPDSIPKIFTAYYSTKRGGTGLGLAMAQRIVHEHGGKLNVSSEVGKGSDFRLTLPVGNRVK